MVCKYAGLKKAKTIQKVERALTFTSEYQSPFWVRQLAHVGKLRPDLLSWSI
jgi:hypothetical protein